MFNKTIRISNDALTSKITFDMSIKVARENAEKVYDELNKKALEIQKDFEVINDFDIGRPKKLVKEVSEPKPIKAIIDKKKKVKK